MCPCPCYLFKAIHRGGHKSLSLPSRRLFAFVKRFNLLALSYNPKMAAATFFAIMIRSGAGDLGSFGMEFKISFWAYTNL